MGLHVVVNGRKYLLFEVFQVGLWKALFFQVEELHHQNVTGLIFSIGSKLLDAFSHNFKRDLAVLLQDQKQVSRNRFLALAEIP